MSFLYKFIALLTIGLVGISPSVFAGDVLPRTTIEQILSQPSQRTGSIDKKQRVILCWSKLDHAKGMHAYDNFATSYATLFNKIEHLEAKAIEGFPSPQEWETADLVIFYLTIKSLSEGELQQLDTHLQKGKSIIVIHQALVQKQGYEQWGERIGFAFSWDRSSISRWGTGALSLKIDNSHEIFSGFPQNIDVKDELYWNLSKGSRGQITVLGTSNAPEKNGKTDSGAWPAFWTVEHPVTNNPMKKGRVFCSVIGHFDDLHSGTFFRLIMLRASAWCLDVPFTPFKSLVLPPE